MVWTALNYKFNTTLPATDMQDLHNNITAKANGDAGAPKNQLASMATDSVDSAEIVAAAVNQAALNTAQGEISGSSGGAFGITLTMPGGEYAFYPETKVDSGSTSRFRMCGSTGGATPDPLIYKTRGNIDVLTGGGNGYMQHRYIQASPPYILGPGDGEAYLFVFAAVKLDGSIQAAYCAPEAPWHLNGPTRIAPDFKRGGRAFRYVGSGRGRKIQEITQEEKNADMALIPHPFDEGFDAGIRFVMLDPTATLMRDLLSLHEEGMSICSLLNQGAFWIGDGTQSKPRPSGVDRVAFNWR